MGNFRNVATAALVIVALLGSSEAYAGAKITMDDTKWISLGIGARGSYSTVENSAPNGSDWSHDFNLDNARIYLNGQIHEYVKFEVNTECVFCGNSGLEEFVVLDAVVKIEINPYFNIWGGRVLVPAERQEMNGPFYSSTYDAFKTPFFPADASVDFGDGGAGVYNRDHGVNIWGAAGPEGAFQYVAGIFAGQRSTGMAGPNDSDEPLVAARFAYNFLNVEKNPGYYTSGTYYGGLGDILTVAFAIQHQKDGSGSSANSDDFLGVSTDVLFEKVLGDGGVFTFNGEFKHFEAEDHNSIDPDAVNLFDGESFSVAGLYLLPNKMGIGQLQPYVRFTGIYPEDSSNRDEFEAGVNYIIDGHNARISLFYQYGDIATKGLAGPNAYAPDAPGKNVSAIKLAMQIQI